MSSSNLPEGVTSRVGRDWIIPTPARSKNEFHDPCSDLMPAMARSRPDS